MPAELTHSRKDPPHGSKEQEAAGPTGMALAEEIERIHVAGYAAREARAPLGPLRSSGARPARTTC